MPPQDGAIVRKESEGEEYEEDEEMEVGGLTKARRGDTTNMEYGESAAGFEPRWL